MLIKYYKDIILFLKIFIWYKDTKKIKPSCIFLPKMSAYRKDFDETKNFLIKDYY